MRMNFYGDNSRFFMLILMCLLSLPLWSENDLKKVKALYKAHDQGVVDKNTGGLFGLHVSQMMSSNDLIKSKKLLSDKLLDENTSKEMVNLYLAKIAIKEGRFKEFQKYLVASQIMSLHNIDLIQDVYQMLPNQQKNWLVNLLVKEHFFQRKPNSACPFFELTKRKSRALFLYLLASNHRLPISVQKELLYELYVTLPEAVEAAKLKKLTGFKKFFLGLKLEEKAMRMENLLTFGKNNEARETFADSMASNKKPTKPPCELDYIDAKVDRKMRKYGAARKRFTAIAATCPTEIQIKARYMDLMLASTMGDEASLPKFDAFVIDYPTHSFADDVLLFKANILLDKGRTDEALEVLADVIAKYPHGDMINRAYFLKGFTRARMGNIEQAIKDFLELEKLSEQDSIDFAQSKYWRARLSIFGDVSDLKNPKRDKAAIQQLGELVLARPTVYSWLAQALLVLIKEKVPTPSGAKHPQGEVPLTNFLDNSTLSLIRKSILSGFRNEALVMLGDVSVSEKDVDFAKEVAVYYDTLNRPEAGHQQLIRCNPQIAHSLRKALPETYARISYPHAFVVEVDKSLERVDVPREIIFAIMRQESGFIAESCSWAGAKGLMQLMYPSALSQAKLWAMSDLKEEDLYTPAVNILLASSLFKNYWQQFGNLALALAAYNAGPGIARSWSNKYSSVPLDTLIESISFKETRDYVKSVLGGTFAYTAINNPKSPPRLELMLNQVKPN
jgi:TolA-binding protein